MGISDQILQDSLHLQGVQQRCSCQQFTSGLAAFDWRSAQSLAAASCLTEASAPVARRDLHKNMDIGILGPRT